MKHRHLEHGHGPWPWPRGWPWWLWRSPPRRSHSYCANWRPVSDLL